MRLYRLKNAIVAFNEATSRGAKFLLVIILLMFVLPLVITAVTEISDVYDGYKFRHLSSAEHLAKAKEACNHPGSINDCPDTNRASQHLKKIPPSSLEYDEASRRIASIQQEEHIEAQIQLRVIENAQAESARLRNQTEQESLDQMLKNVQGTSHEDFICTRSWEGKPVMSFDYGHYWWMDDGRCAVKEQLRQEEQQKESNRVAERQQKKRDKDAESSSYWPTTIRVDTDMDSFWLPNEERTCQTSPDDKGRVEVVACNVGGSHRDHNIPVKFWGGVDRHVVSNWKCRREGDVFVCRAID